MVYVAGLARCCTCQRQRVFLARVTLAEASRLAPSSMRGTVTGGVLSFGQFGGLVLPLLYSLILSLTGSYQLGFLFCSMPALIVGVVLLMNNHNGFD